MSRDIADFSADIASEQAQAAAPAGTWAHIKAACEFNDDLSTRILWCAGVDRRRYIDKFAVQGRLDRLFHLAVCWEWWAVTAYRLAHWAHHRRIPHLGSPFLQRLLFAQQGALLRFAHLVSRVAEAFSGARISAEAEIGPGIMLVHTGSCGIGPGVTIGHTFTLHTDANIMSRAGAPPPRLGDNVTVYSGARIIGPIRIGDNARIGANAVVLTDIPPNALAVGTPASVIEPGTPRPQQSPAYLLHDLITTLHQSGQLEQIAPDTYRDSTTGALITATFPAQDTTNTNPGNEKHVHSSR